MASHEKAELWKVGSSFQKAHNDCLKIYYVINGMSYLVVIVYVSHLDCIC